MGLAFALAAAVALIVGLAAELRLFAPSRAPRRREAIVWSTRGLVLAVAVAAGIALADGPAGDWTTVDLIERSLSLDNVFLFSLLLAYVLVPPPGHGDHGPAVGVPDEQDWAVDVIDERWRCRPSRPRGCEALLAGASTGSPLDCSS